MELYDQKPEDPDALDVAKFVEEIRAGNWQVERRVSVLTTKSSISEISFPCRAPAAWPGCRTVSALASSSQ